MDDTEIVSKLEEFRQSLLTSHQVRLEQGFADRFNEFVAPRPLILEREDRPGQTLLKALRSHIGFAIREQIPFQALITDHTRKVLEEKDGSGYTPLHDVCCFDPYALDIVSFLVKQYPEAAKATSNFDRLPLHVACCERAPLSVISVLVSAYPLAVLHGDTPPLHLACQFGVPLDAVRYLVAQDPRVCLVGDNEGDLPVRLTHVGWDTEDTSDNYNEDNIDFMTKATAVAVRVLMDRLSFNNLLQENVEGIAAYMSHEMQQVDVTMLKMVLSEHEVFALLRRSDVQAELGAKIAAIP